MIEISYDIKLSEVIELSNVKDRSSMRKLSPELSDGNGLSDIIYLILYLFFQIIKLIIFVLMRIFFFWQDEKY